MSDDEEWQERLHDKYRHLFETYEGNGEDGYPGYQNGQVLRGIECRHTWERIVEQLLESLEWHRTHNTHVPNPNFVEGDPDHPPFMKGPPHTIKIFQIKEKFGRFTAYVTYPESREAAIEKAIGYAEGQADLTCYGCGKLGDFELSKKGWITRLCPECLSL